MPDARLDKRNMGTPMLRCVSLEASQARVLLSISFCSCLESVQRWFLTYQHLPLRWEVDATKRQDTGKPSTCTGIPMMKRDGRCLGFS